MRYPASYVFQGHRARGLLFAGCTLLCLKHRGVNPNTLYYVGEWQLPGNCHHDHGPATDPQVSS